MSIIENEFVYVPKIDSGYVDGQAFSLSFLLYLFFLCKLQLFLPLVILLTIFFIVILYVLDVISELAIWASWALAQLCRTNLFLWSFSFLTKFWLYKFAAIFVKIDIKTLLAFFLREFWIYRRLFGTFNEVFKTNFVKTEFHLCWLARVYETSMVAHQKIPKNVKLGVVSLKYLHFGHIIDCIANLWVIL